MKHLTVKTGKNILKIKDCKHSSGRGLMFNPLKKIDGALIYANNVWMLFCKKPLDLYFLDSSMRVLEVKRAIPLELYDRRTWKIYKNDKAKYCLEVAAGRSSFRKGERIKFS